MSDGCLLIVDDDPSIRTLVRKALTRAGHQVLEAGDAETAARLMREHAARIRLVILDIELPGVSGLDFANYLDVTHPGHRRLYISGLLGSVALECVARSAPSLILAKPFTPKQIVDRVRFMVS